ncbi:hypothetical protein H4219_000910 [Mycoemilia scoparia]|uniref:Uncharacterized protein n=1 Tax=Mycoemilia scoparia TaxID=417184 RepID=A0A9W8A2F7_9FUNG|nr:hypothetical protein H4219_000910 [Mycoemilia scoparia]
MLIVSAVLLLQQKQNTKRKKDAAKYVGGRLNKSSMNSSGLKHHFRVAITASSWTTGDGDVPIKKLLQSPAAYYHYKPCSDDSPPVVWCQWDVSNGLSLKIIHSK